MSLMGSGLFLIGLAILTSITGYLLMPSMAEAVARLAETGEYRVPLTAVSYTHLDVYKRQPPSPPRRPL